MASMEIRRKKNRKERKAERPSIVMGDFDETMDLRVHAVVFYHIAL